MSLLKTSEEWHSLSTNVVILDYDGWDRINFNESFYVELITFSEYKNRLNLSTIMVL